MKSRTWNVLRCVPAILLFFFPILIVPHLGAQSDDVDNLGEGVFVKDFVFTGNTIMDTTTLLRTVEDFRNQNLTLEDMNAATELITLAYQEKGYILARAFIPEQEIKDGILQIAILEGNVGKIKVTGNKYYSDRVVKRFFKQQVKEGVIRESHLERGYLLTNDVPKLETEIILEKGEAPGTSDIVLKTSDKRGVRWGVDYNNYGSKFTSRNRYGTTFEFTEPSLGSTFSLRAVTGDDPGDSSLLAPFYTIPINSYGTKLSLEYLTANFSVGKQFEDLGQEGDTKVIGAKISHPLVRARDKNAIMTFGVEHKKVEQEILGTDQSTDEFNAVYLAFGYDHVDRYLGKTIFSLELHTGNVDFGSRTPPSRLEIDEEYVYLNTYLTRIQKIYGYTNLLLRLQGQYSPNRLLPIEQFPIGGYFWVRGHEPATFLGDTGYTFSSEILFAPPLLGDKTLFNQRVGQMLQLAAWFDTGSAHVTDALSGEKKNQNLSGYGGGLRLYYNDRLTFRFDIGWPTDRKDEGKSNYLYFSGTYGFF